MARLFIYNEVYTIVQNQEPEEALIKKQKVASDYVRSLRLLIYMILFPFKNTFI